MATDSLTEMESKKINPKYQNFGNVYGMCVGLIQSVDDKFKLYEIKPLISGKYGMPIRVMTTMILRKNTLYSIKGYLDTILLNNLSVPVLVLSKLTKITGKNSLTTRKSDDFNRVMFASFIYVSDLTVMSISSQQKESIVTLRKKSMDSKYLNVLEITTLTTQYSRDQLKDIKVGQNISIFGTIHRDRKYDYDTKINEVGIKVLEFNPSQEFTNKLLSNIETLHLPLDKPMVFESLNKERTK